MQFKLPFLGSVKTGSDADPVEIVREINKKGKIFDILGGFLQLAPNGLSSEKSISPKILKANRGWVYRNNDVIAQEVSKIKFELYKIGLQDGEIVYSEIYNHPLLDLLDKPNNEAVKSDSIYILQSHKKLSGDAFWLKIRKNGVVEALRTLEPDKVSLDLAPPTEDDPTIIKAYVYKTTVDGKDITKRYDPKDIIHFKKPNPNNPFRGLGVVEALAETIDLDNLTTETTKKFFENGALTNFVLSTDKGLTDDQLRRLKQELKSSYGGASNAYKTMILGGGLKPVDVSYSNKDMQFLDQLKWYRDKIMVGFGNTPASIGIVEDVNRANSESTLNHWLTNTIMPEMEAIVNALNEYLVPEFDGTLVLGFSNPVPEDRTDDIDEAVKLYQGNIIMRSEARGLLEYDADTGDDVYMTSMNQVLTPDGVDPNAESPSGENADEAEDETE